MITAETVNRIVTFHANGLPGLPGRLVGPDALSWRDSRHVLISPERPAAY